MPRLAWFSPMPPVATGVAACSAELVTALRNTHQIDVFVDEAVARVAPGTRSAHDFVWLHHRQPYDLTVFQVGNSSHHDYQWAYLFRYPGLTVLHDVHLHHARAAALLRTFRAADYRTEFEWNHPEAGRDLAELAIAGFDNHMYYEWPMTRLVASAARLVAVHNEVLAARLRAEVPGVRVSAVPLGHGRLLSPADAAIAGQRARNLYGIAPDAIVIGCYGGLSPDKRIPQLLSAFRTIRPYAPGAHLILAGSVPAHYDVDEDIRRLGLTDAVTLTGYIDSEQAFTDAIAACDIAVNLRWPTAREVSGPWLRCLATGKPTIVTDLAHLSHVPAFDPRTWRPTTDRAPVAVAIDILDEDHSLRLALRRLVTDASIREALGTAARTYWQEHHAIETMVDGYHRLIDDAMRAPAVPVALPSHLVDDGSGTLDEVLEQFGVLSPVRVEQ